MNRGTFAGASRVAVVTLAFAGTAQLPAHADAAKAPAGWWSTFSWSGYADGGITLNPDSPKNGINFGNLYGDRANLPVLNQLSIIATRPTDPKATSPDFGFTFQPMYGTDARYTHFYNEFDRSINSRYQFDIVEADALAHLPYLGSGGIDVKLGQYPTPIGYEVINPTGNPLYSHSYIYQFGIPVKHTGILTTTHVTPLLDFYFGLDTGNLGSLGEHGMANDTYLHELGGFGFNLLGGNLTILALTHVGPENADTAFAAVPNVNSTNRYFNDVVIAYKYSDSLSFTGELNYIKDDVTLANGTNPDAYGAALYATYAINDMFTFQARGEVFRDAQGFFVAADPANFDFTDAARGIPNTAFNAGKATYEEVTLGVNFKPPGVPDMFKGTMLRPEIRYDHAEQAKPFDNLTSDHQVTLATDLILPF
jgi:hypothetical protein